MKAWIVGIVSAAIGIATGCGMTWYEFAGVRESFDASESATAAGANEGPRLVVEGGQEHHFGSMLVLATKSHEFVFKNVGTAPLTLVKESAPTCQCTRFEVPSEPILPGDSAKVLLEWKPKEFNQDFTQTAEVKTNDPNHAAVKLTIRGAVLRIAQAIPDAAAFGAISASDARSTQVRVFEFASDKIEIASHEFLNAESASLFEANWEPLANAEIESEGRARAGVLLTIRAKPGLPLGPINQTIRVTLAAPGQPVLEIPLMGTVVSDIYIIGGGNFDATTGLLKLGLVKGSEGLKTQLRISVRGAHRHETKLLPPDVEPREALHATLGEPSEINNGKAIVYVLTIEIPPGTPPVNRIRSEQVQPGSIVINTTHPDAKQLRIAVSFAVQE